MLHVNPDHMCIDGTQTRKTRKLLDPYKKQIQELIECGFQTSQILKKLREMFPCININRTTLSDFCVKLREELFDYTQLPCQQIPVLNDDSILSPHVDTINRLLSENRPMTNILTDIKAEGYPGSYSLLQQYCRAVKPSLCRTKKATHKVKRKDLISAVWSGKTDISEEDMDFINTNYPIFDQIKSIVTEFRTAYSHKDSDAVKLWCEKFAQCEFPAICSFINGINNDAVAFYNSMKYEYSNGLLEGSVNKLKAVKRSMYGRAGYSLLRAKLLLMNGG